jgi:ribosome assembly protein 1
VAKIVTALNLKISPRDMKSKDTRFLLSLIFTQWLSLSTAVIQTVIDIVPAPSIAQMTRIPKILYPDLYEPTVEPKNKLEADLFASNGGPTAFVAAYVSKMFAVPHVALPENKKKSLSADEMRNKNKGVRDRRVADGIQSNGQGTPASVELYISPSSGGTEEGSEHLEALLGFARLYSGTIRTGTDIYAILPKYNLSLDPIHSHNSKYIIPVHIEGLYVMMGRELIAVDSVRAGNIFAIRGLEGKVWRSATLCAPGEVGIGHNPDAMVMKDCFINLGGVNRSVGDKLGNIGGCSHNWISHLQSFEWLWSLLGQLTCQSSWAG